MGKQAGHRSTEILFDAGHGQLWIKSWQLILQLGQFFEQERRHDVRPGGEGLACLDEGRPQGRQQLGAFAGPGPGPFGQLELACELVAAYSQQKEADRDQGLTEPAGQALGMAGVDAADRLRVVLQQSRGFKEIAEIGGVL